MPHLSTSSLSRIVALGLLAAVGCNSNSSPTIPNPFTTADRVPPPPPRAIAPGTAQPYYPASPQSVASAAAQGFSAGAPVAPAPGFSPAPASVYPQSSAYPQNGAYPTSNPAPAVTPYSTPYQPQPAAPAYPGAGPGPLGVTSPNPSDPIASNPVTGDSVAVPGDAGSLRFASPSAASIARAEAASSNGARPTQLADRTPTANSWIAGSAPVRRAPSGVATVSPRIRVPGQTMQREPVSIASLGTPPRQSSGVAITPLEPAPFNPGATPGEPAPLRVATPSTTGWR